MTHSKMIDEMQPYLIERNKILDSWRYHLPFYQGKLRRIDDKLDEIERRYCNENKIED